MPLVWAAVFLGLALRPPPSAAQLSFVHTASITSGAAAPRPTAARTADRVRTPGVTVAAGTSYAARSTLAVARWLSLETETALLRIDNEATATDAMPAAGTMVGAESVVGEAVDAGAAIAAQAVATADRYVGTRYRWGGDSPAQGFDCSGFVRYVYAQQDIGLPRRAREQARSGRPLPTRLDELMPGDLLFFAQGGPTIDHVAIYAGDGRIVHSSNRGRGVRSDDLSSPRGRWYLDHLVGARRIIERVVPTAGGPPTEPAAVPLGEPIDPAEASPPS